MKNAVSTLVKVAILSAIIAALQACSPVGPSSNEVAMAYESSGDLIPVQPYTRTIFSTNNF